MFTAFVAVSLFGQYGGVPWKGTPWQFGADNEANFENRVLLYKYDVGPGQTPAGEGNFVKPEDNLEIVVGHVSGGDAAQWWRTRDPLPTDWNIRLTEAEALEIELDPTDVALVTGWSNFQWDGGDGSQQRIRDGCTWRRFTVEFEPGLYRYINRGRNGSGGNFAISFTLRDTATMDVVYASGSYINGQQKVTIQLGQTPEAPYDALPFVHNDQYWYIYTEVLDLDGTYVLDVASLAAGAVGTGLGEFTFETLPPDKPTITEVTASPAQIDGCDGSTTITVTATPENPGGEIEYRFLASGYVMQDWSSSNELVTYWGGEYVVHAREVGYTLWDEAEIHIEKINCAPTPYLGVAQTLPGVLEFEYFDEGGHGIAYWEMSSPFENILDWDVRDGEEHGFMGKDITVFPAGSDTVSVRDWGNEGTKTSEWAIYTVEVEQTGDYSVALQYFCNVNVGRNMHIEFWDEEMESVHDSLTNLRIYGNWEAWDKDSLDTDYRPIPGDLADRYLDTTYVQTIALKEGTYKIKFYANAFNMLLDKLKFVKVDDITPTLYVDPVSVQQTIPFRVAVNKNAEVYIVPTGTAADEAAIIAAALGSMGVLTNDTVNFATTEIDPGDYLMYAVDKIGNVSAAVEVTVEQLVVPVVQVAATQVFPASPFTVTMDIDGKVYLTPDGTTTEDDIPALAGDYVVEVTADTPADITTVGLDLGFYMIFGINNLGTVSEGIRVEVTTDINSVVDPGTAIIKVYPTVVNHTLNLELPSIGNVDFYNMIGVRVKSIQSFSSGQVNLSDFRNGMYIVKVSTGETTKTFRIIKQ